MELTQNETCWHLGIADGEMQYLSDSHGVWQHFYFGDEFLVFTQRLHSCAETAATQTHYSGELDLAIALCLGQSCRLASANACL